MKMNLKLTVLSSQIVAISALLSGCMDQYNPRPYWEQYARERHISSMKQRVLTEKGEVPIEEKKPELDPISAKFATLCASCHGDEGKADSPAAGSMNPKPRNFHDKKWQESVTDEHIVKVIVEGGAKNGLSSTMPAWRASVTDEEVQGIVKKIREWGK